MKFTTSLMIEQPLHTKLSQYSAIRKMFFGEKDMSMSNIVNAALKEYFDNHSEEINKIMEEYHAKGGCANL